MNYYKLALMIKQEKIKLVENLGQRWLEMGGPASIIWVGVIHTQLLPF